MKLFGKFIHFGKGRHLLPNIKDQQHHGKEDDICYIVTTVTLAIRIILPRIKKDYLAYLGEGGGSRH